MKCNICGKEFGNGVQCQHCHTDRVVALGNYQGYKAPSENIAIVNEQKGQKVQVATTNNTENFIACYACGEIIPSDSQYCPMCAKKLYETCPKCGKTYSSQYSICQYCGTDRIKFTEEKNKIRIAQERWRKYYAEQEAAKKAEENRKREEKQRLYNEAQELFKEFCNDKKKLKSGTKKYIYSFYILFFVSYIPCIYSIIFDKVIEPEMESSLLYTSVILWSISMVYCIYAHIKAKVIIKRNKIEFINDYINENPNNPVNKYLSEIRENIHIEF